MTLPQTQKPNTFHMDEQRRIVTMTIQWLAELDHATHPVTADNQLDVLVCGEESFKRIAQDIEAAETSIDVVCWGFDPGMELTRGERSTWPRGPTYGGLLDAAAARGARVRMLVWHDGLASRVQNNMPGHTGNQRKGGTPSTSFEDLQGGGAVMSPLAHGAQDRRSPEQLRNDYCVDWWRRVLAPERTPQAQERGRVRIEVCKRKASTQAIVRSLADPRSPEDPPNTQAPSHGGLINEANLLLKHGTHHQKTLLIDYGCRDGEKAVGYVMGLNSLTDYWDSTEHPFDTAQRETDWARKSTTAQALPGDHAISRDPYHDYVCRIEGAALHCVQGNFVKAWKRAGGAPQPGDAVKPRGLPRTRQGSQVQILRTQPEESDKTIKNVYWQATSAARNYIYIENQYFFYERWVRHLKEMRAKFTEWLQEENHPRQETKLLHLFAVIPWPEDDGMVPRTYDMVKSLGEAGSMPRQHGAMQQAGERRLKWEQLSPAQRGDPDYAPVWDPIYESAAAVQAPEKNHKTGELKGLGLKVLLARLVTHNAGRPLPRPELNYRQIYVHSKLMLIDDAFFTLGSANMNLRSMAVDSEINVATDDHAKAGALRRRIWGLHGAGFEKTDGGDGRPAAIAEAFKSWQRVMSNNKNAMVTNGSIRGFLIPFEDDREVHFRHG